MYISVLRHNQYLDILMKNIFFSAILILASHIGYMQNPEQLDYIERHKNLAVEEMERTGIPASIKLAQGILESNWGKSELAVKGNNHFGIKCGINWEGKTIYRKDDDKDKKGRLIPSCFRVYPNVEDSYRAHSEFLLDPKKEYRYGHLFSLNPTDYKKWAKGLKTSGYATSPSYANSLIHLIETYKLYEYDQPIWEDWVTFKEKANWVILLNNEVQYTFSKDSETVRELSKRVNIPARKIVAYNEHITFKEQVLGSDVMIYLQPKRGHYRGKQTWHTVTGNQTMFQISQKYGVSLKQLYKRNLMKVGMEPQNGVQIKLNGWKVKERPSITQSSYMVGQKQLKPDQIKKQKEDDLIKMETQPIYAFPEAIEGNINGKHKTTWHEN